ncbi:2-oxoacid:acceptor oxidoreductase subunit alpha, partial [Candidatus Thorarchaeota archaeon]
RKGEKVVESNLDVARAAYDYTKDYFKGKCTENLEELQKGPSEDRLLITGNQGIALGALAANLKWISSYPMSPSTSVFVEIVKHSEQFKVAAMQSEDEIAGLCMAIGASFVGARSMVTTSGGGFSLMVESLGLSAMSETPVVIYNAQRPGPSTGLPTRTEQADLLFMAFASQGEFPRIILAPRDPAEAFHITVRAFNLADRFQVPVMILGDQHLADSVKNVDRFDVSETSIDRGKIAESAGGIYRRHEFTEDGISPRAYPGQKGFTVVSTGNTHNEAGHISENPDNRNKMVEKRLKKIPRILEVLHPPVYFGPTDASVTLVSWGSTWGAVNEVVESQSGTKYRQLHFSDIYPLRTDELKSAFEESDLVVTVEQNATGQFAALVQMETGRSVDRRITKYDGRPMSPHWLRSALQEASL